MDGMWHGGHLRSKQDLDMIDCQKFMGGRVLLGPLHPRCHSSYFARDSNLLQYLINYMSTMNFRKFILVPSLSCSGPFDDDRVPPCELLCDDSHSTSWSSHLGRRELLRSVTLEHWVRGVPAHLDQRERNCSATPEHWD